MSQRDEPEQPGGFGRSPLAGGAIWQRYHHRLQVRADYLELADRLEFHGLAGQVLLGRDSVGEYVEQQGPGARRVHTEGDSVV